MKKELEVFFTSEGKGLTMTSANMIANKAKELIRDAEAELHGLSFVTETVELLSGNGKEATVRVGMTAAELEDMGKHIEAIGNTKALQAWLREAIKAKEQALEELDNISAGTWAKENGISFPESIKYEDLPTREDILAKKSVKERNEIYALEAQVATIGKWIHPSGELAMARNELLNIISQPTKVTGQGTETVIHRFEPSTEAEDITAIYTYWFNKHRELQARLNKINHEIEVEIDEARIERDKNYKVAFAEYQNAMDKLVKDFEMWRSDERRRVRDLKIIIPDALVGIYQMVNSK